MAQVRKAIGSIEPYLVRFVKGKYNSSNDHFFPFPIRLFQTEDLSPKQVDFFIQCYDYLLHGVQVKPSQPLVEYIRTMKFVNTFGRAILDEQLEFNGVQKGGVPDGALLDVVFLPGNQPYLGWFNSGGNPLLSPSLCQDIYHSWKSSKSGCSHTKNSFYDASVRFQYAFQIKAAMCKPSSKVTPRDMKLLHSRHLYCVRSIDNGLDLVSMFTKTISGDPLTAFARKSTQDFPQSLRTLEILMRFSLKRSSSDSADVTKLNDDIQKRCQYLNSNWWDYFLQLRGIGSSSTPPTTSAPPLTAPVLLSTVHCPLFELASLFLSHSNSMSSDQFLMNITNEIIALSNVLDRYEHRLLSSLDIPQPVDLIELPRELQSGLLDSAALQYPFSTHHDKVEPLLGAVTDSIPSDNDEQDYETGWVAAMGLDWKGYLSYALRACDMIASALGASFRQKGDGMLPLLLQRTLKLRHQLRVHHLRRYAFGSTAVWSDKESAVQCFPFFESVCLSLQIRSAIAIVHFSCNEGSTELPHCLPSLQLLSMLFPKLTPCLLSGGSVKSLLDMKAVQQCTLTCQICCRLGEDNTVSFPMTVSQLEELQRQVHLRSRDCNNVQVGLIFRDSQLLAFFNPNQVLPFHHIS